MEENKFDLIKTMDSGRSGAAVRAGRFLLAALKFLAYCLASAAAICIVGAIVFAISFAPYYAAAKASYAQIQTGRAYLLSGKDDVLAFKLDAAKVKFELAKQNFEQADKLWSALDKSFLKNIPLISSQIDSAERAITAAVKVSDAMSGLAGMGQKVATAGLGMKSFSDLSGENKVAILGLLDSMAADSEEIKNETAVAALEFEKFREASVLSSFYDTTEIVEQLALLTDLTGKLDTAAKFLPQFLGYQREKTYLFLLQNNSEMRPSGGFLGTYGIVKISDADINKFFTDNIYNLDKKSEGFLKIPAPEPMKKYMNQPLWFMRDSNWSPDFSMSAEKALEFYDLEKGTEPRIDGVIGITPQVIADLLKVVGPIEIDGLKFAAENFWETLQYEVEYGYQTKGTAFSERKSVIGKLGIELQNRLFKLPLSGLGRVVETLKDNLEIKQIVFYFKDAELQKVVEDYDWAGRVKGAKLDYFMVVDANLAALKTDPFVQRSIQYSLSADGAAPYAELKIKYDHQGKFDLLVTRYRSWTRVYLPSDIEIVDVKVGGKKVEYVVENDLGKKTVGLFLTVEPQTSEVILIKYKFGKSWQSELAKNGYSLLIQKQIGLPSAALIFDLTLPYEVGSFPPIGTKVAGNRIIYNGEMIRDVEAGIVK